MRRKSDFTYQAYYIVELLNVYNNVLNRLAGLSCRSSVSARCFYWSDSAATLFCRRKTVKHCTKHLIVIDWAHKIKKLKSSCLRIYIGLRVITFRMELYESSSQPELLVKSTVLLFSSASRRWLESQSTSWPWFTPWYRVQTHTYWILNTRSHATVTIHWKILYVF